MNKNLIKAHLNLHAVLQNLEELVKLDAEAAELTKDWHDCIQFAVINGPAAYVDFRGGACRHGIGPHANPTIKLLFISPRHLNNMFDGNGMPIPLKGFGRLGFLQKEFPKLTGRLEYYLKPGNGRAKDRGYVKVKTILTLYTAIYAVKELALLEPTSKQVASRIPNGPLQVEVLPKGPYVHIVFDNGNITVSKGIAEKPMAKMTFKNMRVAGALLAGKLDAFQAVAEGGVMLRGLIPMIDNVNLILDRVEAYMT